MKTSTESHYPWYQAFYLAFYSSAFYRYAAKHWRRKALNFFLVAMIILWVPISLRLALNFNTISKTLIASIASEMPSITISQGIAQVTGNRPATIHYPGTGAVAAIIDVHADKNVLKDPKNSALVLVTRQAIFVRHLNNEISRYPYSSKTTLIFNSDTIQKWFYAHRLRWATISWGAIFGIGICFFFIALLGYGVVLTAFASLVSGAIEPVPPTRALWITCMLSAFPPLLVFAILYLLKLTSARELVFLFFLQLIYLIGALSRLVGVFK